MADTALPELSSIPPGVDIKPDQAAIADTGSALDALFKPFDAPVTEPAAAAPAASTPPASAPKPDAGAPAVVLPAATDLVPAATPAVTPATPATPEPVKDEFDAVQLPPHTKSEVATSFETLKKTSRERLLAVTKEREDLAAKVKELETRPAVDPKVDEELKELRAFRQRMDVEADPTFKEYVKEATANEESIWAKLKESGASDDVLAKMKAIGAKDLAWEDILDKLPPVTRRYVENKLAVNEDLNDQRKRAIEEAKKNASEFLAERQKNQTQDELAHYAAAETHLTKVAPQLPWFKIQSVPANATPEQKAGIEAENKFVLQTQDQVRLMLKDTSPQMRAVAALGYAQMLRLQAEIPMLQEEHEAEKKTLATEIEKLKATLKERDDFIARIKGATRTSLRDGGAPSNPGAAASQPTIHEKGDVAIDRLRAEQTAGA
jgi:hypothetical protein